MKAITSLTALVLGASVAAMAMAQDTTQTPPPAEAGAGAAAAVSGAAPAAEPAADAAPAGGGDAPVEMAAGETVLPNGMDITATTEENGRWYNAEGVPTYKIDGNVVDFATFNGYRRYHAECHVCHGPDGEGSTYAPALKNSVLKMDYYQFQEVVASGRQGTNSVMPAFATNKNVWCYVDDIYVYLLAHGTGAIPRGRPAERADKSEAYTAQEDACMSM